MAADLPQFERSAQPPLNRARGRSRPLRFSLGTAGHDGRIETTAGQRRQPMGRDCDDRLSADGGGGRDGLALRHDRQRRARARLRSTRPIGPAVGIAAQFRHGLALVAPRFAGLVQLAVDASLLARGETHQRGAAQETGNDHDKRRHLRSPISPLARAVSPGPQVKATVTSRSAPTARAPPARRSGRRRSRPCRAAPRPACGR